MSASRACEHEGCGGGSCSYRIKSDCLGDHDGTSEYGWRCYNVAPVLARRKWPNRDEPGNPKLKIAVPVDPRDYAGRGTRLDDDMTLVRVDREWCIYGDTSQFDAGYVQRYCKEICEMANKQEWIDSHDFQRQNNGSQRRCGMEQCGANIVGGVASVECEQCWRWVCVNCMKITLSDAESKNTTCSDHIIPCVDLC